MNKEHNKSLTHFYKKNPLPWAQYIVKLFPVQFPYTLDFTFAGELVRIGGGGVLMGDISREVGSIVG